MPSLPIHAIRDRFLAAFARHPVVLVRAPTGSGKSTQIPQYLLDALPAPAGQVVVLQPRRLPARMLARRVSHERGSPLGGEVGYHVRFDRKAGSATRLIYATEGVVLRRLLEDPRLSGIHTLVLDEFHERHLDGDITLGRALQLQRSARPDLKLVIMSATLEIAALHNALPDAALVESEGRAFPVETRYLAKPSNEPVWEVAGREIGRLLAEAPEGDALVFMPGAFEIHRTIQALRAEQACRDMLILPLHGELPPEAQDAAVSPAGQRKIIVSTNVAETSLTIEGVRIVVDSGLARIPKYDPNRGINTLLVEKISRASADQRAGRAGRTAPGVCLRLWTAREHESRPPQELPEVRRLDLSEAVLALLASGVDDLEAFPWVEAPESRSLARALTLLADLGAIDAAGKLTETGRKLASYPLHPRYARMLLAAHERGCVRPVALLAALLQGRPVLMRPEGRAMAEARADLLEDASGSDFSRLLRAWQYARRQEFRPDACRRLGIHAVAAREAGQVADQFLAIARDHGLDVESTGPSDEAITTSVLAGLADHVAVRLDAGTLRCALPHRRRGALDKESAARDAMLLVAAEVREVQRKGDELEVLLSTAAPIQIDWLKALFPEDLSTATQTLLDPATRRVVARRQLLFRDLVLESDDHGQPNLDEAAAILAEEVLAGRAQLPAWNHEVDQWFSRVACLREWQPEYELPAIGAPERRAILEQICHGALSVRELKDRPVWPVIHQWLSPAQQSALDQAVPERMELPGGRRAKITYTPGSPPVLATRIQDLFGVRRQLTVAGGRQALRIHLLAPNMRPVQITDDLETFWKTGYAAVRQELQRKYPKHAWPEPEDVHAEASKKIEGRR